MKSNVEKILKSWGKKVKKMNMSARSADIGIKSVRLQSVVRSGALNATAATWKLSR